jgi:hypothetical protein
MIRRSAIHNRQAIFRHNQFLTSKK